MRLELTRRADYGVRAMVALASAGDERLSSPQIAARTASPRAFVGQVMRDLVASGLVEGRTGRTGGYRLARPATRISILDIVEAVEGDARRRTCVLRGGACARNGACAVHEIFSGAQDALLDRLARSTLASAAGSGAERPSAA